MAEDLNRKTLTAPLAVIKINGFQSGFMRNVRVTETIQRAEVKGISNLTLQEVPPVGITCNITCDFFFISLKRPEVRGFLVRDNGLDSLKDTLILGERPIDIQIFRKVGTKDSNGIVTSVTNEGDTIASIQGVYLDSTSFDIAENQVSGSNISARYLEPIFFNN